MLMNFLIKFILVSILIGKNNTQRTRFQRFPQVNCKCSFEMDTQFSQKT